MSLNSLSYTENRLSWIMVNAFNEGEHFASARHKLKWNGNPKNKVDI